MRLHTILCHGRKSSMALVKATNARFGAYHVYRHYIVSKAHSIISPLVNHASMLTRLRSLYHVQTPFRERDIEPFRYGKAQPFDRLIDILWCDKHCI